MPKLLFFVLASTVMICSCATRKRADQNRFVIRGTIDSLPGARYFVEYNDGEKGYVDTIRLDPGKRFTYRSRPVSEPTRVFFSIENTFDVGLAGNYTIYVAWPSPEK